jgi:hypothetical protein
MFNFEIILYKNFEIILALCLLLTEIIYLFVIIIIIISNTD